MKRELLLSIQRSPGSYSDRWLARSKELGIAHQEVDCYAPDIMSRLASSDALLWHWFQHEQADQVIARAILAAAEIAGLHVYPNTATCWHFDDKVAQKYLLEAIGAPLARTWVLVDAAAAHAFVDATTLPIVFKLRRGAGSVNVQLVRTRRQGHALVRTMFGAGIMAANGTATAVLTRVRKKRTPKETAAMLLRAPLTAWAMAQQGRASAREKGYFYAQEFLDGNAYDTRITIIGDRAFAFTRNVRPRDFRASGSGSIDYDERRIDPRCIQISFHVARRIGSQSLAFDFVRDGGGNPRILEISYGFNAAVVHACPGYWDEALGWHAGQVWPQDAILDDVLAALAPRMSSIAGAGRP